MREREKYVMTYFHEYDHCGLCEYLEQKARQGWMYIGDTLLGMRFLSMTPRERKFQIVYLPQDELLQVNLERLKDYCAMDGWVFIKENNGKCIFFNDRPDPIPIETDPVVQVENIHKCMEKTIKNNTLIAVIIGFNAVRMITDLIYSLISMENINPVDFPLSICYIMLVFMIVMNIQSYRRWYTQASQTAKEYGYFAITRTKYPEVYLVCTIVTLILLGVTVIGVYFDFWELYASFIA